MEIKKFDCCAYDYVLKCQKPMMFATSMVDYEPMGLTGNGRCNQGECGFLLPDGTHEGKLGREPKDGPRGPGATRLKNSLPEMWLEEVLLHALDQARIEGRTADVVVDVCAGWQSLRPVCARLGLRYVALDIHGNRNK